MSSNDIEYGFIPSDGFKEEDLSNKLVADKSLEEQIKAFAQEHKVLVLSKSTCAFCHELKRTLAVFGVCYSKVEVDKVPHHALSTIQPMLKSLFNHRTFPMLIVDGEFKGGCDDLKALEYHHNVFFLAPYMNIHTVVDNKNRVKTSSPLFWFPDSINNNAARVSGGIAVIICVLCIAFWKRPVTPWVVLALAIDFTLRFFFGAEPSFIGMTSSLLVSYWAPDFRTGAPKQFAAFCGTFFSVFSAGLFLGGEKVGGAVVLGALMGAAFLEAAFDFCLGCEFFGIAVHLGIVPPSIYRASINLKLDKKWGWSFENANTATYPKAVNERVLLPGQVEPSEIDLIRKDRIETEYKQKDYGLIRFTRVEYYAFPMSIAALSFVFNLLCGNFLVDYYYINKNPHNDFNFVDGSVSFDWGHYGNNAVIGVRDALGIFSAVVFVMMTAVYLLKLVKFPKKVKKEWDHPTTGNMFSAISICLCLYGMLMYSSNRHFGITMVWFGAVFQMFLSVVVVSRLVFEHHSEDVINPSILMAPVGNFVGALALAAYPYDQRTGFEYSSQVKYVLIARLWFAVALLFFVVLLTVTLKKSFSDSHADVRLRPMLWIWQAAAAVAGPAFFAVTGDDSLTYQSFFLIAMFFFAMNVRGWLTGFYKFTNDMSIWAMAFACSALAISTIHYYSFVQDIAMRAVVYIVVALACYSNAICLLYTALWATNGTLFRPKPKWSPITVMKLTHEAFRVAIPQLCASLIAVKASPNPNALKILIAQLKPFLMAYTSHGVQEDEVLFPEIRDLFPGLNPSMSDEHEVEHEMVLRISDALKVLSTFLDNNNQETEGGGVAAALELLYKEFPAFGDHLLNHMRNEENSATVVIRKYVSIARQIELAQKMFLCTSAKDWHVVIPYVLTRLPHPVWKVRYLRSFIWAMPDRAQQIGLIVHRGVDSAMYAFLTDEIPEMIPRGAYNYKKKY